MLPPPRSPLSLLTTRSGPSSSPLTLVTKAPNLSLLARPRRLLLTSLTSTLATSMLSRRARLINPACLVRSPSVAGTARLISMSLLSWTPTTSTTSSRCGPSLLPPPCLAARPSLVTTATGSLMMSRPRSLTRLTSSPLLETAPAPTRPSLTKLSMSPTHRTALDFTSSPPLFYTFTLRR
ncbi:hypothetical protein FVEG_05209 [Fusarium verticillioides 7600]|uniref:Uncharacterized protein n=1 Tax=Gibberella moniliformis (strain M3125 / FGSC 7600) TaxID=334819 RepID=W7LZA9_GIBM7|nr:hypothetical protein FVEG_05209 [Fusarium verticillioides 7600]XP_018750157.1 hypothetical protein FVEG_05209 [Fusarium verticillioides 7600]XP_018750158.1 hypothetical protein FVEG_05209 [Fusarium verticillioides 7600]XP_018750159.1 hypothetical protein FVEG_05209 [Fusarium verticillioides 7600]XP_018750160.1 hypothetical protein FVEG_05209 [Fusarium verticillioides 7600]XP_018750161.1 hypothetical protein FVEG_05209 [Fusarium verticillioides 7600]XP_018750162.1 hypothetical protein FVEG_